VLPFILKLSTHWLFSYRFMLCIATNQSGLGAIIVTAVISGCSCDTCIVSGFIDVCELRNITFPVL